MRVCMCLRLSQMNLGVKKLKNKLDNNVKIRLDFYLEIDKK